MVPVITCNRRKWSSSLFQQFCLYFSTCNIHGKDLLTAAKILSRPAITQPFLRKLDISGMILDEHTPGGMLHKELRQEFQKMTHILAADYHGHNMADHMANM